MWALKIRKKSLDRLWWTQGREDHSFRLGTEYWLCALLWAALGADGPSWCLLGGCHGNLKLGSPAALVDDRNPLNLFLHSVLLFVYLQVSFPLDTHLPSPHKPTLTGAGTPPSAWKTGNQKVLPWQAEETECHCLLFNQIKEELCLLIKQPCMDNSGRLEKHLIG